MMKILVGGRQDEVQIIAAQLWLITLMYAIFVKRDQQNIKKMFFLKVIMTQQKINTIFRSKPLK